MNLSVFCRCFCLLLLATTMFAACSSTKNTGSSSQDSSVHKVDSGYEMVSPKMSNQSNIMVNTENEKPSNLSLTDKLQRLPGVRVQSGRGPYAKFVVNGQSIGTDYSSVYNLVNPSDVSSLSVLKGADATIYGTRGANGVILIRTKSLK
ncbi:MAG: TonB-dependent receptor plug domain-containing protein [Bacteroidales bacterium]|nr:TonB-dependent receptor plug domain-containing protein [Bacteroidales bacterium]